jgi:hypothetical protein
VNAPATTGRAVKASPFTVWSRSGSVSSDHPNFISALAAYGRAVRRDCTATIVSDAVDVDTDGLTLDQREAMEDASSDGVIRYWAEEHHAWVSFAGPRKVPANAELVSDYRFELVIPDTGNQRDVYGDSWHDVVSKVVELICRNPTLEREADREDYLDCEDRALSVEEAS